MSIIRAGSGTGEARTGTTRTGGRRARRRTRPRLGVLLFLTASERRAALVVVFLLLLGATRDLWRAHHPRTKAPGTEAGTTLDPGAAEGLETARTPEFDVPAKRDSVAERPPDSRTTASRRESLQVVDLNRATARDLDTLPGVGPVLAARILDHRRKYGPFRSVDELLAVRGIGPRLLERVRPHVAL